MKSLIRESLIILFTISFNVVAQGTYPKIFSPNPNYDFGEILEGQVVEHEFEIVNNGTAELIIKDVRASCGCTAVQPAKKNLQPNEKTKIKVKFDSHGRIGPQKKYVYVFSNDPRTPQYRLSFNAIVVDKLLTQEDNSKVPKLVLSKKEHNFGDVDEGIIVETQVDIKNEGTGTLEIKDVKSTCGCTATLLSEKILGPGEKTTLKIKLDTTNRMGKLIRVVSLYTNDPEQPVQVITLNANIIKRK